MYLAVGEGVPSGRRTPVGHGSGKHLGGAAGRLDRPDRGRENPCARTVSGLVSSPRASTLTRPRLATRPAARAACPGVTSVPASNVSSVVRFTTWYSTRNGLLNPFAFGVRRCSGVWPPSNRAGTVPRAPWPLLAAAGGLAALAADAATDAALRPASSRAPASGRGPSLDLLHAHEVRNPGEHPADLGPVGQHVRRTDLAEAERAQRAAVLRLGADLRPHERDFELVVPSRDLGDFVLAALRARGTR